MGLLCLSTARDEPLVFETFDGPVIITVTTDRRPGREAAWRILAPPTVGVLRGKLVEAETLDELRNQILRLQDVVGGVDRDTLRASIQQAILHYVFGVAS